MKIHPLYLLLAALVAAGIFSVVYYDIKLSPTPTPAVEQIAPTATPTQRGAAQPGVTRTPRPRNTPTPKPTQTPPVIPPPPEPGRMNLMVLITILMVFVILIGLGTQIRRIKDHNE